MGGRRMIGENVCPICGRASRYYMGTPRRDKLCGKHADLLKSGEIRCLGNGKYIQNDNKILNINENHSSGNSTDSKDRIRHAGCICCGNESLYSSFFCVSCFNIYKNKKIIVSIDKCKGFILLDESYEGNLKCKDGHIVKSEKERFIDDYLFSHRITHSYEPTLPINLKDSLHPDFLLPKFKKNDSDIVDNVYLEYFGFGDDYQKYYEQKKYKMNQYKNMKLTVICISKKETDDFNGTLDKKLKFFEWYKITI